MTKNLLNDESYYFEAFMKTVQYLATLTTHKDIMKNLEKLIKKFYNSDFFAFYECGADGTIIEHLNKFSNTLFSRKGLEKIEETIVQVLESGFFASELIPPPDPYAIVFLPISKANQIISVIVIGHKYSERLPKYLLNIYLALGGLIGTTIEKLTNIQELRTQHQKLKKTEGELMKHRDHLEKLVEIRTEELKESEKRFRELANSLPQVISETDERGNLTFVNNNAYNVFGYTPDDYNKGLNALQMLIPEDRKRVMKDIMKVLRGKEEEEIGDNEYTALRKDGSTFPVMIYSSPIIYNDRSVGTRSITIDITDRKKVEQKLKESEERFRELANSLPQVISETDERGNLTFVNNNACNVFGYTPDDYNKGLNALQMLIPEDRKRAMESIKRILKLKGKEEEEIGDNEYTALRKDGSTFPVIIYSSPIIYNDTSVGTRSIIIDITDRKKAEEEITNALEEIKRSNTELEQFAYVASHDLQEPLRMVASFTQLLQKRYQDKLDDEANEFFNFAVDGVTRMQGLIKDLLTLSRIGTKSISFSSTDMNIILEQVLANIQQSTIEADAEITNDPLPVIIADESQMRQILQNLISNAIKFREKSPISIHVSGEDQSDKWVFSVKDNGIGIDPKYFERIFIIFQRLHKRDEYEGTGIGLAVCKKIIQRHGGKIWVESELGKGSTFYFSIKKK